MNGHPHRENLLGARGFLLQKRFATLVLALALLVARDAHAESSEGRNSFRPDGPSVAVNLGLIQPLALGGANIQVDLRFGHFIAAWSHGWSLEVPVVGEMQRQGVELHLPYTTGLSLGVQYHVNSLNSYFDLRFEAKAHRFEASYASLDGAMRTQIANYNTFTVGGGAYWTWMPFAKRSEALAGINISTSLRLWPKVADTLAGSSSTYESTRTGQVERHEAANIGIGNTPLVGNVSIGYIFQ
jgi:hypothetical protein